MHRSRLLGILLSPSLLSFSISFILSAVVLGVAGWSRLQPDNGVHEYLFGPYGLATILQNSTNALSAINGVFNSPGAYNVAVGVFALLVGLLVYVFLEGADHIAAKTTGALREVELISDQTMKKRAERLAGIRLVLRIAALISWIFYLIFFARVIVPACLLIARIDVEPYILTWDNVFVTLIGFALLLLAIHVHVIFMRLLLLRPRLFGGDMIGRGGHED